MQDGCRLSVVITSRNDDHGGDMLRRFRIFADALVQQADRHGLRGELLVVEWNPPEGPRLHEVLGLRRRSERFPVRFIEVPEAVHRTLPNSDVIPLYQMIAKNVGIRRARGRFVLATNPDLLFSDELVRTLASGDLDPRFMYRLDRTDVGAEIPEDVDVAAQLDWCRENVLRVHTRWGTVAPGAEEGLTLRGGLAWLGSAASGSGRHESDVRMGDLLALPLQVMRRAARVVAAALDRKPKVHTNGCGDFTLLSRQAWHELRGYPELPIWSMHLDSLLCYMAVAAGHEERSLRRPARMYHIEHGSSWVVMDLEQKLRTFARKPWLDTSLLGELWAAMYEQRRPVQYNAEGWGFAAEALPETVFDGDAPAPRVASATGR